MTKKYSVLMISLLYMVLLNGKSYAQQKNIEWNTLRGIFSMSFKLEPAAEVWTQEPNIGFIKVYRSGDYKVTIDDRKIGEEEFVINYELIRTDGKPFKMIDAKVQCKTSYSGIYKIFNPGTMNQQNYQIDLPFRIAGGSRAEHDQPVIWMQQTDGKNTLTIGLLDQISVANFEGSTYDTHNGGEAPGIANSYVRVSLNRPLRNTAPVDKYKDGIYVNANSSITWFEALKKYSKAVDSARNFKNGSISDWALNPMWHSWYAHADVIDEKQIRIDGRLAKELGMTTIEIDAGWNIPPGVSYSFDNDGDYVFDPVRFPDPKGMIDEMHTAGQRVVLHVGPLLMGKDTKAWKTMKDCMVVVNGKEDPHMDPRLKKVHDYLLNSWEFMFKTYGIDGLWYDFLELPEHVDPVAPGREVVSTDIHVAYTLLMESLYKKALAINPNATVILRRGSANLNSKTYCSHVWPSDTPQDYNMNRRDVVYLKTFGDGVVTHACCTSWSISEEDVNVARHMASLVMAGVPAFSFKLAEATENHKKIVKAWLKFYELNKNDLVFGSMNPLLPTPPSAALSIDAEKQAFVGFFEAIPGLVTVAEHLDKVTIINAFNNRTATRVEGVSGTWQVEVYDQTWQSINKLKLKSDNKGGININLDGITGCHSIVLTRI